MVKRPIFFVIICHRFGGFNIICSCLFVVYPIELYDESDLTRRRGTNRTIGNRTRLNNKILDFPVTLVIIRKWMLPKHDKYVVASPDGAINHTLFLKPNLAYSITNCVNLTITIVSITLASGEYGFHAFQIRHNVYQKGEFSMLKTSKVPREMHSYFLFWTDRP